MSKKILLVSGHSRVTYKWGMVGEITRRLLDDPENKVYYLDCNNTVKSHCALNRGQHWGYCKKCSNVLLEIIKLAGLPDENIIRMKKFMAPKFLDFKTIREAIDFDYEGYNYGLGPVSCIMTLNRDYDFDIKKEQNTIKKAFTTEYTVFKNLEAAFEQYHFDEIHTFNGRMPFVYPCVSYAVKNNIPYYVYEAGCSIYKYKVIKNSVPHDYNNYRREMKEYWDNRSAEYKEIATKWFDDRRKGKFQAIESFTKDQIKDLLPDGFDFNKENIAIFNSSIDEVYAFDSWKHPFADNENDLIEEILEHYKDDTNKHFYLRIHPNLTKAKRKHATQIRQINEMKKKYHNLTVIEPDQKIDTYALIEAVNKVLTFYSSVGCEATYYGTPSILAGKAAYDQFGCVYKAKSLEETFELIDTKDLQPKPKETAYPFGYYNAVYGEEYKYFKVKSPYEGEFMGMILKDK